MKLRYSLLAATAAAAVTAAQATDYASFSGRFGCDGYAFDLDAVSGVLTVTNLTRDVRFFGHTGAMESGANGELSYFLHVRAGMVFRVTFSTADTEHATLWVADRVNGLGCTR